MDLMSIMPIAFELSCDRISSPKQAPINKEKDMEKQNIEIFLNQAKESRAKHSTEDRLFALEVMACALGASLEGESRDNFLKVMNSISENINPMNNSVIKAIADLNVLSADFKTLSNQLEAVK
jgi:hypothetical protein